jgi:DTW domain-containing protein YfiP
VDPSRTPPAATVTTVASASASAEPRVVCRRCRRPARVCYCASLPTLETRTKVVILQHPRERDMPIGTARMASLCLPHAELHVGIRWAEHAALAAALADPARPPILLYPGPDAKDVLREPPAGPVTLIMVDGTWSQAKSVVRDNPILQALPRYAFAAPEPSQYRIRREPSEEYTSTIEALMHVLGVLEGAPERFRALLTPLRTMVDNQLACQKEAPPQARRALRRRGPRTPRQQLPPALFRELVHGADLVCVAAEANSWPYRAREESEVGELVHWVAHRLGSGERFESFARPSRELSPSTLFHTGLEESQVAHARPVEEVVAAFDAFLRPGDQVCTWGTHAAGLYTSAGGALPGDTIDLRAIARREARRKIGCLESFAGSIGVAGAAEAPLGSGRAGRRLAMMVDIVRSWRASQVVR